MRTNTKTAVTEVALVDLDRTYRGNTGCACGCGGEYYDINDAQNEAEVNRRIKYVLRGIREGKAEFFGNGVEVANPSYTKVTRLYFKDGIDYDINRDGTFERTEEGPRVMDKLSQAQIAWTYRTGLPTDHMITKIVYNYAEGSSSLEEYSEFYSRWTPYQKDMADKLVLSIAASVERNMN
jgi:hypothetical protein